MEVGTKAFIEKYIEKDHDKDLKDIKVKEYKDLKKHSDGKVDDALDMMVTYQPSEPEWAIKYKKDNYRAITKAPFKKIQNAIAKIQKARDLIITPSEKNSPKIKDSETLYSYVFERLPKYNSINQWFFNFQIKNYLTDSNGVVVIAPKYVLDDDYLEEYQNKPTNEFIKPIPYSFSITKVKYFEDDLLIIEEEKNEWFVVDENNYYFIKRDHVKEKYTTTLLYSHNLGYLPAIVNGGVMTSEDDDIYYESWIAGILPDFDQALLENIDKNVTIKQHLYPERVEFTQNECTTCNGTGSITKSNSFGRNVTSSCNSCGGDGFSSGSPFGITKVRPAMGGEDSAIPQWAPVKYVEKDLKPVEFLSKDIDNLIKKGLGAVNMEFLAESPTDQSGVSKAYDYDQTHQFLSNISNDVFGRYIPFIIKAINDLRYSELLEFNQEVLREQLPSINIPNDFDIVTTSVIEEQIGKATQSGISSSIIESMEMDYIAKKYEGSPKEMAYQQNIILLDALRGMTSDDIMTMNALTPFNPLTLISHSFINTFVERAFSENKDFATWDLSRKKELINKYAQEYKDLGSVNTQSINPLNGFDNGNVNDIEAEAKAKLKGSVGGVQGLIEIQQSVSAGTTQYESAIIMLGEIYGFDDVTARKLLGNPIDLRATQEKIK
jgi:hypothetical protein